MIIIDKHIKNALHQCLGADANLSQASIAKFTGIQQPSISRWISGLSKHMGDDNWFKILPYIENYLPDGYEPKDTQGRKKIFTINQNYRNVKINSHNNSHNSDTTEKTKDPLEVLLLRYFRTLKNEGDKLKLIASAQEMTND
ncbi:MAG: helix-turn-helix domain-containing protein [Victivallales bacterium]|nr:helix-turn-helix domain-containing protein [Victivallales bacterium]